MDTEGEASTLDEFGVGDILRGVRGGVPARSYSDDILYFERMNIPDLVPTNVVAGFFNEKSNVSELAILFFGVLVGVFGVLVGETLGCWGGG